MIRKPGKIAFAFGGLGGFNAHGVGFLQAAKELGVVPEIISCTSGMIGWVADWIAGKDLEKLISEQIIEDNKFPPPLDWMNSIWTATFGNPRIFRPAIPEYWARWLEPVRQFAPEVIFDKLMPSQLYVPLRTQDDFQDIATVLSSSSIPIMFNSFHPHSGRPYLHVNAAACDFLNVRYGDFDGPGKYLPINTEAVSGALWLYFYGFSRQDNPRGLVDGAYNRQFIIREMHCCDRIYAARPQSTRWLGRLPQNWFETQDFNTELWFNSAYLAEIAGIDQINKLLERKKISDSEFHHVDIIPVEIHHQYGYFQYFVEERSVYENGYNEAYRALLRHEFNTQKDGTKDLTPAEKKAKASRSRQETLPADG